MQSKNLLYNLSKGGEKNDNVKIGQLILKLRKENNMTQLQLADLVLHTSRFVLSKYIKTALSNEGAVILWLY